MTISYRQRLTQLTGLNESTAKLLLLLICWVCYGNTVLNEYSLDDDVTVTENAFVQKGIRGIPDIITNPHFIRGSVRSDYRPVPDMLLAIEHQFFGNNPHVSHALNVLLYSALLLLIFSVLRSHFDFRKAHPAVPFLITLFYAVHPAHTEVVASIKNREEILSFLFAVLAMKFFRRFFSESRPRLMNGLSVFFFTALALLSKMVALPVVAVIILWGIYQGYYKKGRHFFIFSAILLLASLSYCAYIASIAQREILPVENPIMYSYNLSLIAGTIAETILFYFRFLLFPYPFRFYYGYDMIPLIPFLHPLALFSVALHLILLLTGVFLFIRKRPAGFFILAYLINIFFYSNIYVYTGIVAERALFTPSLWFIAASVLLLYAAGRFDSAEAAGLLRGTIVAAGVLIFTASSALTVYRNFQWKDVLTLMSADIVHLKNSAPANFIYGRWLMVEARRAEGSRKAEFLALAKKHFMRSAQVAPWYREPHFRLGMIYEYEEQNRDSAFRYFLKAYQLNPAYNPGRFQLAKQYYLKENYPEAEKLFASVYQELPHDTLTLFFYPQVLYRLGKKDLAFQITGELLHVAPATYYPYYNYGMFYYLQADADRATEYLEQAVRKGCRDAGIFNLLLDYYRANGLDNKIPELQKLFNTGQPQQDDTPPEAN